MFNLLLTHKKRGEDSFRHKIKRPVFDMVSFHYFTLKDLIKGDDPRNSSETPLIRGPSKISHHKSDRQICHPLLLDRRFKYSSI